MRSVTRRPPPRSSRTASTTAGTSCSGTERTAFVRNFSATSSSPSLAEDTRLERKGALTLAFDQVTINGRAYPIRATVTQAIGEWGVRGEAGKIGAGAGVGAILGGILGGVKGAIAGILIGGGGTIAATEGKDVELPAGTVLRVRLDSGLNLR